MRRILHLSRPINPRQRLHTRAMAITRGGRTVVYLI